MLIVIAMFGLEHRQGYPIVIGMFGLEHGQGYSIEVKKGISWELLCHTTLSSKL